jgi:hypothetical protein
MACGVVPSRVELARRYKREEAHYYATLTSVTCRGWQDSWDGNAWTEEDAAQVAVPGVENSLAPLHREAPLNEPLHWCVKEKEW